MRGWLVGCSEALPLIASSVVLGRGRPGFCLLRNIETPVPRGRCAFAQPRSGEETAVVCLRPLHVPLTSKGRERSGATSTPSVFAFLYRLDVAFQ